MQRHGIVKEHISKRLRIQRKGFLCVVLLLFFLCIVSIRIFQKDKQGRNGSMTKESLRNTTREKIEHQKLSQEIRVLIRNSSYEGLYHDHLEIRSEAELLVDDGREERSVPAGESIHLHKGDKVLGEGTVLTIAPKEGTGRLSVINLVRSQGNPSYIGRLEIREMEEGLLLINILPMEEYLCGVLPSEMPASFPEEALKAQAICARTYACKKMLQPGYPELKADLDDSTAFQVYGNLEEQESCTKAVRATNGLVLVKADGSLMDTYYYSTSCGRGTSAMAWQKEEWANTEELAGRNISRSAMQKMLQERSYQKKEQEKGTEKAGEDPARNMENEADFLLIENPDDYEATLPWYRWSYQVEQIDCDEMAKRIQKVLGITEEVIFHEVLTMQVTRRAIGGAAWELKVITDQGNYIVRGEHAIREVLCDGKTEVVQRDGTRVMCSLLLPSAFFLMETSAKGENVVGYSLNGGGLGHGIGMSQNAAGIMAEEGRGAEEILAFFYEGGRLHDIE